MRDDCDDALRREIARDDRRRLLVDLACMVALSALVWSGGCCHPRPPTYVAPPPCLARLAPLPPSETAGDDAWQRYHVALEGWAAGVERSCGAHLLEPVAVKPDPGPAWWTKQPSGAVGDP